MCGPWKFTDFNGIRNVHLPLSEHARKKSKRRDTIQQWDNKYWNIKYSEFEIQWKNGRSPNMC